MVLLVITSLKGNAQYYLTVDELVSGKTGQTGNVRVSGVVLGDTIQYDPQTPDPVIYRSQHPRRQQGDRSDGRSGRSAAPGSTNPDAARLQVIYNGVKPDLLKNEAQAIMTGSMGADGVFYAEELLFKCPSRYEDSLPGQAE